MTGLEPLRGKEVALQIPKRSPRVSHATWQRQNRRQVDEKASFVPFLSVRYQRSPCQGESPRSPLTRKQGIIAFCICIGKIGGIPPKRSRSCRPKRLRVPPTEASCEFFGETVLVPCERSFSRDEQEPMFQRTRESCRCPAAALTPPEYRRSLQSGPQLPEAFPDQDTSCRRVPGTRRLRWSLFRGVCPRPSAAGLRVPAAS